MANTLTFANMTLTDANIFGGISYITDLNAGDEFTIGNTASSCVTFVTDTQVPLYSKDSTNGVFTWEQDGVTRGTFYVTEVTKGGGFYTVTAYDGMILLETSIEALGITTYPATASDLADAIETFSGYTITGTLHNGSMTCIELDDAMTVRQLLGYIAEISGASVKLNASDELCLMYYEDSEITLTASDYREIEVADYVCSAIDCVKIVGNDSEVKGTAGTGDNTLFIAGNPFADSAADANAQAILSIVGGFTYTPLTCSLFDEEGLEVGIGATFGTAYTLVMSIDASTENGVTVTSVGEDSRAEFNKSLDLKVTEAIAIAQNASDAVDEVADYFWTTPTDTGFGSGAHITQKPRSQVLADPTNAGGNLLARSNGIAVRDGLTELATFGANGTVIGKEQEAQAIIAPNHFEIEDASGVPVFKFNVHNGPDGRQGTRTTFYLSSAVQGPFTIGTNFSIDVDSGAKLYNKSTGAFIEDLTILDDYTVQVNADLSAGYYDVAYYTYETIYSASIGIRSTTIAAGAQSFVAGNECEATAKASIALGEHALSDFNAQLAVGRYNLRDLIGKKAFIVGNGTADDARSNALTVDWNGNVEMALDTTAASGTDHDICTALVALGWDSDVIV